jgi:hypothetical protein
MRVTAECAKLEARGSMVLGHDAHEAAHAFPKPLPRRGVTSVDAARGGLSLRAVQPEAQSASVRGGWSKAGAASWSEIGRQQPDADGAHKYLAAAGKRCTDLEPAPLAQPSKEQRVGTRSRANTAVAASCIT